MTSSKSREDVMKHLETSVPKIDSKDLTNFDQKIVIGKGAYSDVYSCRWNNSEVAVKVLRFELNLEETKSLELEASIGIKLPHPNIVRMFGLTESDGWLGIVMEQANQGNLRKSLKKLTEKERTDIALDICNAVEHLHSNKIVHRDLKPDNILIFSNGNRLTAKLADFGISRVVNTLHTNTSTQGTAAYVAPERMSPGYKYGVSADIYSLSILLYELFSGLDPFPGCDFFAIYGRVLQNQMPDFPADFPSELQYLIEKGWSVNPSERPAVKEFETVLQHMVDEAEVHDIKGMKTHTVDLGSIL
jgi:serine/threonine protein kinase